MYLLIKLVKWVKCLNGIDNLLPDYIPGGLIASLFTESVNEIKNKFDIQKTFGKDVHAIKKTKEGNFIVQGNLDKIRKTAEKNNINIEDVENWGVRIWTESVNEGKHYEDETRFKTKNGQIAHIDDRMGDKYYITYYDKNGNEKDDGEIWLKDIEKNIKIGKWIAESVNEGGYTPLTNDPKTGKALNVLPPNYANSKLHTIAKKKFGKSYNKLNDKQQDSILAMFRESVNESKKSVTVIANGLSKVTTEMKKHAEFYVKAKAKGDAKEMKQHIGHLKTLTSQKKELERGLDGAISGLDKDVELVANEHVVRSQIRNIVRESLAKESKSLEEATHPLMKKFNQQLMNAAKVAVQLYTAGQANPNEWSGTEGNDVAQYLRYVWNSFSTGKGTNKEYEDEIFK